MDSEHAAARPVLSRVKTAMAKILRTSDNKNIQFITKRFLYLSLGFSGRLSIPPALTHLLNAVLCC